MDLTVRLTRELVVVPATGDHGRWPAPDEGGRNPPPGYDRPVADLRSAAHLARTGPSDALATDGTGEQLDGADGDARKARRPEGKARALLESPAGALFPLILVTAQVVLSYLHLRAPAAIVTATGNLKSTFQGPLFHRLIYSDLYTEYSFHNLFHHPFPYLHQTIEYPVLTGIYMSVAAALTHNVREYFLLSSIGLWVCAAGSVLVLWSWSRRAAWLLAVCPLVFLYALLNWDVFAIFLMLLGWHQYRRGRYASAGAWLSAGTFAKVYPAFLLVFLLIELARRARAGEAGVTRRSVLTLAGSAAAVAVVINVPFMVLNFSNWAVFWRFNARRRDEAGLLYWARLLNNVPIRTAGDILLAVVAAILLVGAAVVWRGASARKVAAVVFAGFLLVQKVYSPQYTLWLVVFALLAEWEAWTLVLLTAGGLYDYVNSVVILELSVSHSPAFGWYYERVFPLGRAARLSAIGISAAGAVWAEWRRKQRLGSEPPPGRSGATTPEAGESRPLRA